MRIGEIQEVGEVRPKAVPELEPVDEDVDEQERTAEPIPTSAEPAETVPA